MEHSGVEVCVCVCVGVMFTLKERSSWTMDVRSGASLCKGECHSTSVMKSSHDPRESPVLENCAVIVS